VSELNATHAHSSFRAHYTCRSQADIVILVRPIELAAVTSATVLLELPVAVVERAHLASLQPAGDAVEVERVLQIQVSILLCSCTVHNKTHVADSPRDCALFTCGCCLIGLAVDAQVHDVVTANGAVVDDDVPGPECDSVPLWRCVSWRPYSYALEVLDAYLLHLELLLSVHGITACAGFGALDFGCSACIGHLDVGHGCCLAVVCGVFVVVLCRERARCGVGGQEAAIVWRTVRVCCLSGSSRIYVVPRD
jgi:hypothetical protein